MTVLLSGDTITLSGTATDADAVAQFTSIAGCSAVAESGRTRLVIPYKLSIVGTLTNSSAIAFTFSRAGTPTNEVVIQAGGRWNYKEARTVNGLTDWRIMPPIIFTQTVNNGYNGQSSNLIYVNGGIIDHAKVEHQGNGGQYYNGGTVIYRDVVINAEGLALVNDNQITTQSGNPTIDIIGLEVRGASMFFKGANIVNFKAYKPKFVSRGYGGGFGEQTTLQDFDSNGATFDLSIYAGGANSLLTSNNGVKGGGVTCGAWNSPSNNGTLPNEYRCTADLLLTGINEVGAAVVFKAYHLDNNTNAPVGAGVTGTNYVLSKAYNVTASVAGVATLNMLLGAGLNDNAMVRRSATQTDDLYAFKCFSYLSSPTTSALINLAGAGVKAATVVQLKDASVSQLVKATVDAYTTIDTLDQFYDRAKSFLFDNFAGETAALLLASGTTLNAGAKNIVVDASASVAFAYISGTNTITIKASTLAGGTKFKAIATTGSFTLLNGAVMSNVTVTGNVNQANPTSLSGVTVSGTLTYNTATTQSITYTNSNIGTVANSGVGIITILQSGTVVVGDYSNAQINFLDSLLTAQGVDSVTLYSSQANANSNTSPGPVVTSSLSFKFGSSVTGLVMSGTLYVRAVIGTQTILSNLAIVKGVNLLDLGVPGQIAALTSKTLTLAQIESSQVLALKSDVWGAAQ